MGLFKKPDKTVRDDAPVREPQLPMPEGAGKEGAHARPYVLHWLPPQMAGLAPWMQPGSGSPAPPLQQPAAPQEGAGGAGATAGGDAGKNAGGAVAKGDGSKRPGGLKLLSRLPRRWRIATIAALVGGPVAAGAFAAMLVYYTAVLPHPLTLRNKERAPVIRILARDGGVMAERGTAHDYVPIDFVPPHVKAAVVATEDRRFFEHWGVDPMGLARAALANLRAGRVSQGGSTLTQQLAKNLFLTAERTLGRKVEELVLAVWLEMRLSKADILELYLNQVYFGGGAYGIEAAAQRYFDKSVRSLTLAEAAIIAGLLKAPSKYSPASSPGAARARGRVVLSKMRAAGAITAEDERRALRQRVRFAEAKRQRDQTGSEYAVDFVLERLPRLIGSGHAELIVETTFDMALQRHAQSVVEAHLAKAGAVQGAGQAAVIVLDHEGGIRALVGGRNHAESEFNRAVKARRQPGSAFKPFVYLAALEKGATAETIVYDLPLQVEGWAPRNDSGQYLGPVTLRQAISQSINTVAVRLYQDVGGAKVTALARRLGITSELRDEPSLALGTSELTLIELTGAYGVLANGGVAVEPSAIRRIRLSSGRVLYAREAQRAEQLVSPSTAGELSEMLHSAVQTGTGRRAAVPGHPTAGKTGTTQDFRDAWFVGYTGHLSAGVWVGNDNGRPMNKVSGGSLPAAIWHEIMQVAHLGKSPMALPTGPLRDRTRGDATAETQEPRREILPWQNPRVGVPGASAPVAARRPQAASAAGTAAGREPISAMPLAGASAAEARQRVVVRPPASKAASRHPRERIDADFLERVLRDGEPGVGNVAAGGPSDPAPGVRAAPEGMMSLGGGQSD